MGGGRLRIVLGNDEVVKAHREDIRPLDITEIVSGKVDSGRIGSKKRSNGSSTSNSGRDGDHTSWLYSGIRVRVISKKLKDGRYYNKKGKIVDGKFLRMTVWKGTANNSTMLSVITPKLCVVMMEDGVMLEGANI